MIWHQNPSERVYDTMVVQPTHFHHDSTANVKIDEMTSSSCRDDCDKVGLMRR